VPDGTLVVLSGRDVIMATREVGRQLKEAAYTARAWDASGKGFEPALPPAAPGQSPAVQTPASTARLLLPSAYTDGEGRRFLPALWLVVPPLTPQPRARRPARCPRAPLGVPRSPQVHRWLQWHVPQAKVMVHPAMAHAEFLLHPEWQRAIIEAMGPLQAAALARAGRQPEAGEAAPASRRDRQRGGRQAGCTSGGQRAGSRDSGGGISVQQPLPPRHAAVRRHVSTGSLRAGPAAAPPLQGPSRRGSLRMLYPVQASASASALAEGLSASEAATAVAPGAPGTAGGSVCSALAAALRGSASAPASRWPTPEAAARADAGCGASGGGGDGGGSSSGGGGSSSLRSEASLSGAVCDDELRRAAALPRLANSPAKGAGDGSNGGSGVASMEAERKPRSVRWLQATAAAAAGGSSGVSGKAQPPIGQAFDSTR
jgi:hypothetical protein